jgi:heptosyltransferase-1
MSLVGAAALLAHAAGVVGVDTGLTHLAVALDVPTVGIYCATDPALTGLHGGAHAVNVGGPGESPAVEAVVAAIGLGGTPA